jgi:hypothetical protein
MGILAGDKREIVTVGMAAIGSTAEKYRIRAKKAVCRQTLVKVLEDFLGQAECGVRASLKRLHEFLLYKVTVTLLSRTPATSPAVAVPAPHD